jgi:hypothetical protein
VFAVTMRLAHSFLARFRIGMRAEKLVFARRFDCMMAAAADFPLEAVTPGGRRRAVILYIFTAS